MAPTAAPAFMKSRRPSSNRGRSRLGRFAAVASVPSAVAAMSRS